MNMTSRDIPLLDFARFTSTADDVVRKHMLMTRRSALETYGFWYLRNHGVAQSLIDAVFAQSRQFFSLSPEVKNRAKPKEQGSTRGYEGVGVQALEAGRPSDLKEIFQCAPEPARAGRGQPAAWVLVEMWAIRALLVTDAANRYSTAHLAWFVPDSPESCHLQIPEGWESGLIHRS